MNVKLVDQDEGRLATEPLAARSFESRWPGNMHNPAFYLAVSTVFPLLLALATQVSQSRWSSTKVASLYILAFPLELWILPFFPAEPKPGPVYQHITHFVPLGFPLLVIPAFAIDLLRRMLGDKWGSWKSITPGGCIYFATILAAQWNFTYFLLSPEARNRIFRMAYFPYSSPANTIFNPYFLYTPEKTRAAFVGGMALALASAIVSSGVGMGVGEWMRRIKHKSRIVSLQLFTSAGKTRCTPMRNSPLALVSCGGRRVQRSIDRRPGLRLAKPLILWVFLGLTDDRDDGCHR